jgi:hypothetical protein
MPFFKNKRVGFDLDDSAQGGDGLVLRHAAIFEV